MCVSKIYLMVHRPVFNPTHRKKTGQKIHMSSISQIGPIPMKNKYFSINTRE